MQLHEFHAAVVCRAESGEVDRGGAEVDAEASAGETLPELQEGRDMDVCEPGKHQDAKSIVGALHGEDLLILENMIGNLDPRSHPSGHRELTLLFLSPFFLPTLP